MPDGMNFNYITLVPKDGVPVTLCDAQGNPYATTGTGALVFSDNPEIHNAVFTGDTSIERIELANNNPVNPAIEIGGIGGFYGIPPGAIGAAIDGTPVWFFDESGITVTGDITYSGELHGAYHTPLLVEGDLFFHDAVGPARLPRGTAGQALVATTTGIQWGSIPGVGTVTQIDTQTGELTGGPITTAGTIGLANTAVTPGVYGSGTTIPVLTIDNKGRVLAASSVNAQPISIGDAPPGSPTANAVWWSSALGQLFVYYNDGNSTQWVPAAAPAVGVNLTTGNLIVTGPSSLQDVTISGTLGVGALATFGGGAATTFLLSPSPSGGIGYTTGAGGAVTQLTNKAVLVALNRLCGTITMNASSLGAGVTETFTMTNTSVAANDAVLVWHQSGGTIGAYTASAFASAGSVAVSVTNRSAAPLAEAIVLQFIILKAVVA